jgi:uncharacterized membrane protein YoaK (UPF0700 family)
VTGNLVFVGLAAGRQETALLTHAALAILVYGLGVLCCHPVLAGQDRAAKLWPVQVTMVIAAQLVLLIAAFIALAVLGRPSGWAQYAVLSLYAFSMGMQSAAFRVLRVPGILGSTYVSGNVVVWFSSLATRRLAWPSATSVASLIAGAAAEILLTRGAPHAAGLLPVLPILGVVVVAASPAFRSGVERARM